MHNLVGKHPQICSVTSHETMSGDYICLRVLIQVKGALKIVSSVERFEVWTENLALYLHYRTQKIHTFASKKYFGLMKDNIKNILIA